MKKKRNVYHDCDEHWVMYITAESPYCTSGTNIALYVNYNSTKIFQKN